MKVATMGELQLALLRCRMPEPALAVLASVAVSLGERDGGEVCASEHRADIDAWPRWQLVPAKAEVDLVLVGHARSASPTSSMFARIGLGPIDKQFRAVAAAKRDRIPLDDASVRAFGGGEPRVGPATPASWSAAEPIHRDQLGHFNVAPQDQRLSQAPTGATLLLEGLLGPGERRALRLPQLTPTAALFVGDEAPVALELHCDTVLVDTDRERAYLTFRGAFREGEATRPEAWLGVSLEPWDAWWERPSEAVWHEVAPWSPDGYEPYDRSEGDPASIADPDTVTGMVTPEAPWGERPSFADDAMPFREQSDRPAVSQPRSTPSRTRGGQPPAGAEEATAEVDVAALGDSALPFGSQAEATEGVDVFALGHAEEPEDSAREATEAVDVAAYGGTAQSGEPRPEATEGVDLSKLGESPLPFASKSGPVITEERAAAVVEALGDAPSRGATVDVAHVPEASSPRDLPFEGHEARPPKGAPAPVRPPNPLDAEQVKEAPAAAEPAPPAPEAERLPIDKHAAIKVALLDGTHGDEEVLEAHGLDAGRWRAHERRLAVDLAREAAQGKTELSRELREAMVSARAAAAQAGDDDAELAFYVAVRAEVEEAEDAKMALDQLGLTVEEWERMRRDWTRRALSNRALGHRIHERLREARAMLRKLQEEYP